MTASAATGPAALTRASGVLLLLSLLGLVLLGSQSGASWATYLLALLVLVRLPRLVPAVQAPAAWAGGAMMLVFLASHLWSPAPSWTEAQSTLIRVLLQLCLLLAVAEQVLDGPRTRLLIQCFVPAMSLAGLAAIWSWWGSPMYEAGVRLHGLGLLENPNVLGLVGASAVVLAVFGLAADDSGRSERVLYWACLPALLVCVALTDSRNAWFCTGVGVVVALTLQARATPGHTAKRIQILVGLIAGATLAVALGIDSIRELLFPRGTSIRPEIWQGAMQRITDGHLLFGLGAGAEHVGEIDGEAYQHTHNLFLAALFHTGLLGVALLLGTAVLTVQQLLANRDLAVARLALALLAVAGSAALVDQYPLVDKVGPAWLLFWVPVGVAMGLHWRERRAAPAS